ncbi:uncharacterized protein LOC114350224 [Ostrinia furnacalis]|uniref:uncharacterized protein LOC114350224 n=1 Tax=Ostrinia furnacalis TaxID=93504 RepID=UPI0010392DB9|nr:uncharacterized protein LOC114350224 [Ostrinia furnacalis]
MSGYLWGIGQLVNDPSPHLINVIHRHIFKKQENVYTACNSNHRPEKPILNVASSSSKSIGNKANDSGCVTISNSKKVCELPTVKSEGIQVGGVTRRRHVSTQTHGSGSVSKKLSRTTSVRQVDQLDRSTAVCYACVKKKNAETNTEEHKVCNNHRQVFAVLSQWPISQRTKTTESRALMYIKSTIRNLVDVLKLEKIETIPPYRPQDKEILKLYRSASFDHLCVHDKKSKVAEKTKKIKIDVS